MSGWPGRYAEAGLEDTQNNANAIRDFVNQSAVHGYWSREIVDSAIANLGPRGTGVLTWCKKEEAPSQAPPESAEVLGTLRNGESQLPLDADERTMKAASVTQLKDLIERRRKATNQQYIRKGFGSSF